MSKRQAKKVERVPSLGDQLVSGLEEISEALRSGEPLEKRFTVRTLKLDLEPTSYGPDEVKAVRDKFGASQALFAKFLGVSVPTLQKWEQGQRPVPAIAARYLDDVQAFPELWFKRVQFAKL